MYFLFLENISLITGDECIESNVISIEAKKFLEEQTSNEMLNDMPTNNDEDAEEDLVCESVMIILYDVKFSFSLVRSHLIYDDRQ